MHCVCLAHAAESQGQRSVTVKEPNRREEVENKRVNREMLRGVSLRYQLASLQTFNVLAHRQHASRSRHSSQQTSD